MTSFAFFKGLFQVFFFHFQHFYLAKERRKREAKKRSAKERRKREAKKRRNERLKFFSGKDAEDGVGKEVITEMME